VKASTEGRAALGHGTIKVLIVDDTPFDAELSLMELRRAGVATEFVVAADEAELRTALVSFAPDVILCDFGFPNFDGFAAQRIVREVYPETPLIFVSGTISEDRAVMALQSGAVDYVLKSNLLRLPSAVTRAVRDARARRRLEGSLEDSEERARRQADRLEALWRVANNLTLGGPELIVAMLRQAAVAIRPHQRFIGLLKRIEGEEAVLLAIGADPDDRDAFAALLEVGSRSPIEQTIASRVSRTQGWDDTATMDDPPEHVTRFGWRSALSTQFDAGGFRYSLTFASPQPTTAPFTAEDFVYLEVLASSFASQVQVNQLEDWLRAEEEYSRRHAARLESLLQIINDVTLRDEELWLAMLTQAAQDFQPGQAYSVTLWRIDGADMIIEAHSGSSWVDGGMAGYSMPLSNTGLSKLLAQGGGTRSWDDVQASNDAGTHSQERGIRSLTVTTFSAGSATWALSFSSKQRAQASLRTEERNYVELLASFFANHVQQRWQFDRLQFHQAHDVLTGLFNRSQFRSQAIVAARTSFRFAIVLIDIDAFHEINESFGNMIGDAVLVEVGTALQSRAVAGEIVGRIGGDVFAVYIPNPPTPEFARSRALELAGVFAQSFSTGDREGTDFISRTCSLAVALAPEHGTNIDSVLSHADAALFAAKERGHGSIVFYESGMEANAQLRAALRNEIAEALTGDQFTLYYQPHVEVSTGAVTGCEALIRWNHPVRGLLLPGHFIPFAEQNGIITSIDAWVMRNAFAAAKVLSASQPDFRLYFNLSGRQAGDPKLIRAFTDAARDGVPMGNLGVEITESDAMRDVEATRRVCRALRRLGVRIAIDDFGTGYSSLSFLKRLPVDVVKIDQSFIAGLMSDHHDAVITETIISIAERFGFASLAEGVERPEEIAWLRLWCCGYMQGFAICHPLPLDAFLSWLAARTEGSRTDGVLSR
jgi:diguanylate cyclase (GGDEF)-like protein